MHKVPVLITGAGPAGMLLAVQLARNGVRSMLIERNSSTTKWPKMDVTNCRSMELYRRLRIADGFRQQGVRQDCSFDVLFSTGLSDGGELVSKWDLASPNEWRDRIKSQNDGSMPREPYQRCSQSIFEAWLKQHIEEEPLISVHFGLRFETFQETVGGIESIAIATEDGTEHTILNTDWKSLDPEEVIAQVLGGSGDPCPITVDEILVSSCWRPSIAVADQFASKSLRVFLAGDSAHQNIPTGGYGMNTAVGDSFDLGWKLAAVINGGGGSHLLQSYEMERKPIAIQNIERSGVHFKVHQDYVGWVTEAGPELILSQSIQAKELKERIHHHVQEHAGENQDHGIEMGYRYNNSPIILRPGDASKEPQWSHRNYIASTWPGSRAPHLFLSDGKTSIFDHFGQGFTLVDFSQDGKWAARFTETAKHIGIQLKPVHLPQETTARKVWGRDAVLIRPDDFVSWRASEEGYEEDIEHILRVAAGYKASDVDGTAHVIQDVKTKGFTSTVGNVKQDGIKLTAAFQK
ncbi:FAD binding domain-containing protein [Fusarium mexicanum]|uniref:FAD binding domain-containing protein n=1 Tax=Fusarium mexicanum TaxID=751941 RepID=A0A8H5IQY5_9HYPO|nr:FAD binding domain-containing protein [Fusarium mexicanum]